MTIIKKIFTFLAIVGIPLFFYSCDFGEIKSKATTGDMTIEADENLESVVGLLSKDFTRLNPEAKITPIFKPTKNVITDLLNKETKLIIIAGDMTEDDKKFIADYKIELQKHELAIDGIAFIINSENPAIRLTSKDLKSIFSGEIKKWSQIKAQDEDQNKKVSEKIKGINDLIKVYIQRPNSNSYQYVKDTILDGQNFYDNAQICSTSVQMLDIVRENKNAIGFINMGWLSKGNQDVLDTTVQAVRVSKIWKNGRQEDFAQFHQGLIFNKKYPYTRKIILYSTDIGIQLSTGFITFLLKNDGQKIFLDNGFVPITQPIRTIQIE
ncbi:MAG: substrate-binding domain-containing protein [Ignavibacteriae bacterium]|nr:substrate-binding domain-containing protein [Ignavibacteriota bacterium]